VAGAMSEARRSGRTFVVNPAPASRLPGDESLRVAADKAHLAWTGPDRAVVRDGDRPATTVLVGEDRPAGSSTRRTIEVVVGGWRFELEVEDARRADLRKRATRDPESAAGAGGPLEIHAIIPGRVVAVAVAPGDAVAAGQTLLLVEAMKMQNELRAPRDGTVERIAVGVGETIDLGDLLVVLG
jgi:biotin carboxyl carrier protein